MKKLPYYLLIFLLTWTTNFCFAEGDAVSSFEKGVEKVLKEKKDSESITYDVRKTDSLVTPLIGILKVKTGESQVAPKIEYHFNYRGGKWVLADRFLISTDFNDVETVIGKNLGEGEYDKHIRSLIESN